MSARNAKECVRPVCRLRAVNEPSNMYIHLLRKSVIQFEENRAFKKLTLEREYWKQKIIKYLVFFFYDLVSTTGVFRQIINQLTDK